MTIATIFGDCASRHAYKLFALRALLNLDVEWVFTDISDGSTRTADHLARNPMGQVPAVVLADGRALPESNAALVYFAQSSALWPADPYDQAQVMRWLMFEQNQIDPALAVSLSIQKATYPVENADIILAYLRPKVERLLSAVDRHLAEGSGGRAWFVGDSISIADIAMYAYLHEAESAGFATSAPTKAWIDRVAAQPRWVSVADAMASERA